uniref:Equilibrative nucleoside transporter 3 n=1 Tax=Clastoptera arizonana TaxID=38151 RepID=A0A1B6CLN8_9HEMI
MYYIYYFHLQYWMYKFRELRGNLTLTFTDGQLSNLQACFTSYISLASTVPSTIFLIINPLYSHKITLKIRMVGSLSFMLFLFIVTTVFVEVNTDHWQNEFFILTISIVVLLNVASAILQSGLFGVVGKFPSKYITAAVSGQALGGILAAVSEVTSLWVGASPIRSAFVYFIMADVFILISLFTYVLLSQSIFFKYYLLDTANAGNFQYAPVNQPSSSVVRDISYTSILKKIWVHGMSVFFCFVVTLSLYPSVTGLINTQFKGDGSAWHDIYFVPVVAYLLFSCMDYMGRLIAGWLQWPENRSCLLGLFSVLRIVFVPLILLCNAQPRHHLPVLIHADYIYVLIVIIFGLSNGYIANIVFICVPKIVDVHEQETASSMMAAFLGVGLACGSALGLGWVEII